ncbi:HEPN domain-containing protein [Thermoplasmatales archaeon SW_10_69_26]|nr:MAG: HEPN domain-containing protein [Thermoplasmatales archaeon SW_10_69_26]
MTGEVEALLDRAGRYLDSAGLLLDNGDPESCVSRAYYAMFFVAEAALLEEGVDASTHRGVITEFGKRFVQDGPLPGEMGRLLSTTMQKRQVSDYEPEPGISKDEARGVLEDARGFVDRIAAMLE